MCIYTGARYVHVLVRGTRPRRKRERERKRRKRVTQNRKRYRKKTSCFRRPRTIVFERKIESDVRSPFPASLLLFLRCDLAPVCDHNFEPHRARVDKRGARIFLCLRGAISGRPVYGLGESWFKVSRGGASCSSPRREVATRPPSPLPRPSFRRRCARGRIALGEFTRVKSWKRCNEADGRYRFAHLFRSRKP